MRTYLIVLAKMRRPSTTPSARMPRSLSSRTTAAASLATSAADSTEIPTSAWWSAIASLTPSPRKATSEPRLRWARMIRDFCSGVTRAKIVVFGSSATRASSSSFSSSCPVTTVPGSRPTSPQRCAATWPLSPVTILTVIPSRASRASDSLTSGLTGSVKQRKPSRERSRSSSLLRWSAASGRLATATTRVPEAKSSSRVACAWAGTVVQRARTASGAPLEISSRPCCVSARTEASCRSWSKGRRSSDAGMSSAVGGLRCSPERAVELVAGLVAAGQAEHADVVVRLARAVERLRERDLTLGQGAGLVGEQHLDVAEVLDRDQTLDDHALLGQPAGAGREADGHDRRQQLRRQADRDREREQGRLRGASGRARR